MVAVSIWKLFQRFAVHLIRQLHLNGQEPVSYTHLDVYKRQDITVAGFETTDRRDFYDLAVGNVPFGQYKVNDKAYNKLGFSIRCV